MKELTIFEMEEIAGGYSWDFSSASAGIQSLVYNAVEAIGSTALGAIVGAGVGTLIGGTQSGENGGLLGFGMFGNLVGMFWGMLWGGVACGAGALAVGWDETLSYVKTTVDKVLDGTFVPWS